jgi:hypothetical protein
MVHYRITKAQIRLRAEIDSPHGLSPLLARSMSSRRDCNHGLYSEPTGRHHVGSASLQVVNVGT